MGLKQDIDESVSDVLEEVTALGVGVVKLPVLFGGEGKVTVNVTAVKRR
jgi:hypothetical protein